MKTHGLAALLICSAFFLQAQQAGLNTKNGVALEGYDPVSYFSGGPEKGFLAISARHNGITYVFTSEGNRAAFMEAPELYLPAYGGWCAYAMAIDGSRVEVDPKSYKIRDGRLFLFYHSLLNNTLKKWNAREDELLPQADLHWNIEPNSN